MSAPKAQPLQLNGKTALVTGASRGIGFATARALAHAGCNVVLAARDEKSLRKAARGLARTKGLIEIFACDVGVPAQVNRLMAEVRRSFYRLDILVNNAGIGHANAGVVALPFETWRKVMQTNLDGMFLVTQAALPLMKRGGAIVNNLSIAAKRVFAGSSAYNASKHGALGLSNTLREELRTRGIRVIVLLPGATDTAIWNTIWPEAPRSKMMAARTVAEAMVSALVLPQNSTVEEITLLPSAGVL